MATVEDVAEWMRDEFEKWGELGQDEAARTIQDEFGDEFVTETDRGGYSIRPDVRKRFGDLTGVGSVLRRGS